MRSISAARLDIAFLPDGSFYVSDGYDNRRVVKSDMTASFCSSGE